MRASVRATANGLLAAIETPLRLRGRSLPALLAEPSGLPAPRPEAETARRVALAALARLGRIPGSPWRPTCLYRSAAACLALRRHGVAARVRIGVRRESVEAGDPSVHAWLESPGRAGEEGHVVFGRARADAPVGLPPDGALGLEVAAGVAPLVRPWLPVAGLRAAPDPRARIRVGPARGPAPVPAGPPSLALGQARGWIDGDAVRLRSLSGEAAGTVDLEALSAEIEVDPAAIDPLAAGLQSMLTVAAALLLGRLGRALVHAAAVEGPAGALLLVGDARSGKSTTTAALIAAGWGWLADDQVVLYRESVDGPVLVAGWPRAFHLDDGWSAGNPRGTRSTVDPAGLGPGRWVERAPLAGVVHPRVEPGRESALEPWSAGGALEQLVRQSPWTIFDEGSAAAQLDLLKAAASVPAVRLRSGLDAFRSPARVADLLVGVA